MDKYYTKKNTVEICFNLINKNLTFDTDDLIIEPSAGNGAFIEKIKQQMCKHIFYDIYPENTEIIKNNFLDLNLNLNLYKSNFTKIHIIGNPPFGKQSSIAIKFIKKCCKFADSISFILPKSFKKNSLQKKFSLNYHLVVSENIPDNSFTLNNQEYPVPCVFQIWEKRSYNREIINKIEPINFKFVKKNEYPSFSFRRVGANAGNIDIEIESKSIQSHYFIKINDLSLIDKFKNIKFTHDNTVGPRSINKQELTTKFNLVSTTHG